MATADRSTLFINATVLDGSEHMEPQPDMAVVVERGIITWMGPSAVAQAPAGAEVIDLAGAYLMPGLINMHVHLCGSGKPVSAGDAGALMKKLDNPVGRAIVRHILKGSAQQQLASGVTTVRGAGDPLFADIAVRDVNMTMQGYFDFLEANHPELAARIEETQQLSDEDEQLIKEYLAVYKGNVTRIAEDRKALQSGGPS